MSDLLLELSQNPQFKKVIKSLGLPVPPKLDRADFRGYASAPLDAKKVAVWTRAEGGVASELFAALGAMGARVLVPEEVDEGVDAVASEQNVHLETLSEDASEHLHAIILDASSFASSEELDLVYEFLNPILRRVDASGRVLLIGRPPEEAETASVAATQNGLEGFMRSVAKEVGRNGATAQLLRVSQRAHAHLEGALRFFLTPHSAYIDGQPLTLDGRVTFEDGEAPAKLHSEAMEGKVALVTGAARGIGKATAKRLAAEGARVVCLDLPSDSELLTRVANEVGGDSLPVDLTSDDAPQRIANFLQARHGRVDLVVHNAGVTRDKTLAKMKPDQWKLAIDVNLRAVEKVTEELLETETLSSGGRLVCLTSVAGISGNRGQTNYACAKSGLIGYVEFMAKRLATEGIAINAVAPGFIETRMTDEIPVAAREVGRRLNNLSQGGQPLDVAEAITFLGSPLASGVTGQVLRVCGGMMMGA